MNPATPMPMMTSASSTLTAAMMPSMRLVVPNSLPICTSERRALMRVAVARRLLSAFAERVVQQLPPLVGDPRGFLDGRPEAHELAREIVESRLDLATNAAAVIGEEQVA